MKTNNYEVESSGNALTLLLSMVRLKETKRFLIDSKRNVKSIEILNDVDDKIEIVDWIINNKMSLDLMVIKVLPVLPAELRPSVVLDDNMQTSSDLNELYKGVINANNVVIGNIERLKHGMVGFNEYITSIERLQ